MTDLTAEVTRAAGAVGPEPKAPRLLDVLVAEAPPEAEELYANSKPLPGWICAAVICGLAAATWAVIIFVAVALLSK